MHFSVLLVLSDIRKDQAAEKTLGFLLGCLCCTCKKHTHSPDMKHALVSDSAAFQDTQQTGGVWETNQMYIGFKDDITKKSEI